jgi:hypothetical protein
MMVHMMWLAAAWLAVGQPEDARIRQVDSIIRADYEADLASLKALALSLPPASDSPTVAARLRYWRGFALWRRVINGFNEAVVPHDVEADTRAAIREFELSRALDPQFVDATVGLISCLQLLTFMNAGNPALVQELVPQFSALLREAMSKAPNNPRLLWVQGQSEWYTRPGAAANVIAERQSAALKTYERGLALARRLGKPGGPSLDPAWGEPELLMNLAWAHLNKAQPDPATAQQYAQRALALVPNWHYVGRILMPQIERAIRGQADEVSVY